MILPIHDPKHRPTYGVCISDDTREGIWGGKDNEKKLTLYSVCLTYIRTGSDRILSDQMISGTRVGRSDYTGHDELSRLRAVGLPRFYNRDM